MSETTKEVSENVTAPSPLSAPRKRVRLYEEPVLDFSQINQELEPLSRERKTKRKTKTKAGNRNQQSKTKLNSSTQANTIIKLPNIPYTRRSNKVTESVAMAETNGIVSQQPRPRCICNIKPPSIIRKGTRSNQQHNASVINIDEAPARTSRRVSVPEIIDLTDTNEDTDVDLVSLSPILVRRAHMRQPTTNENTITVDLTEDENGLDTDHSTTILDGKDKRSIEDRVANDTLTENGRSDNNKTMQCPICMHAMNTIYSTRCGHVFCYPCIRNWIRQKRACPVCRTPLTMLDIHQLFLPC